MIKFSVVVPVYNVERYIGECIESVLAQTYQNFELILVDDGSKDRSGAICDEYAQKRPCVKSFHKLNSGQTETRCYGVEKSSGDYILFLDSDDVLAPHALETISNKFAQYDCDMVVFKRERFKEKIEPTFFKVSPNTDILIDNRRELLLKLLSNMRYSNLGIKALKKRYVPRQKDSLRYSEDLLLTVEIAKQNPKTLFFDDVLYGYRENPTSVTRAIDVEKALDDELYVRNYIYTFLQQNSTEFTKDDLAEYRRLVEVSVLTNLIGIVLFRTNKGWKYKVELLEKIRRSPFFDSISKEGWRNIDAKKWRLGKKLVWILYNIKTYRMLYLLLFLRKSIRF